jgi:hypothetical protein
MERVLVAGVLLFMLVVHVLYIILDDGYLDTGTRS